MGTLIRPELKSTIRPDQSRRRRTKRRKNALPNRLVDFQIRIGQNRDDVEKIFGRINGTKTIQIGTDVSQLVPMLPHGSHLRFVALFPRRNKFDENETKRRIYLSRQGQIHFVTHRVQTFHNSLFPGRLEEQRRCVAFDRPGMERERDLAFLQIIDLIEIFVDRSSIGRRGEER